MSGWVIDVLEALGYLGLALVLIAENLFPPIPSEAILPLAGYLVRRGHFVFLGALAASTLGSVAGALVLYAMGRHGGRPLVLRYGRWLRVGPAELDKAEDWCARYGDMVVLWARMVPLARSVVSVPAGTARMPLLRFTVLTALGSAAWNAPHRGRLGARGQLEACGRGGGDVLQRGGRLVGGGRRCALPLPVATPFSPRGPGRFPGGR